MDGERHVCDHDGQMVHVFHGTDPSGKPSTSDQLPWVFEAYKREIPGYPNRAVITVRPMTPDEAEYNAMRLRRRALLMRYPGTMGAPPDFGDWLRQRRASDLAHGITR